MRFVFVAAWVISCLAATTDDQQFNGRWDITVNAVSSPRAWWLEVSGAGTVNLKGKFVGAPVGEVDKIPKLSISDGELRFALEGHFRKERNLEKGLYWARLEDAKLKGTFRLKATLPLIWSGPVSVRRCCPRKTTAPGRREILLYCSMAAISRDGNPFHRGVRFHGW